jgi:hypothetical protein
MNPSHPTSRRKREVRLIPEALESRELLTGSGGSTFAVLPGTVAQPGGVTAIKFTIDPAHFLAPKGKLTLGIDIAPDPTASLKPSIVGVKDAHGHALRVTHSVYDTHLSSTSASPGKPTTALLTTLKLNSGKVTGPQTYEVDVRGLSGSSGKFLLGFFLPGDANGDGVVNQADINALTPDLGALGGSTKYNFDADANRNGRIDATDLRITAQNMGVSTDITPTVSANLDPNGMLDVNQRVTRNPSAKFTGNLTPGATLAFSDPSGKIQTVTATADAKGDYSVTVPLAPGQNTFKVSTKDAFGQNITGTLSPVTYDTNPPVTAASQAKIVSQISTTPVTVKSS